MRVHHVVTVALACSMATGCGAALIASIDAVAEPSNATISIEVVNEGLMNINSIHESVESYLHAHIREKGVGVPVVGQDGDLKLLVRLTGTNFTAVTAYDWKLIDTRNGAVIDSGVETSTLGADGQLVSATILGELVGIDTRTYASGAATLPVPTRPLAVADSHAPPSTMDGAKSWAVIIGIEGYRNELAQAQHAERDAAAFHDYAKVTLGVPETHIKLLLGERATRTDMAGALFEWLPRNAVSEGGTVYVFFSGHGAPNAEDSGAYLVPYDADPAYLKTGGLAVAELNTKLSALKNQRVYVFLDACFTGSGDRSVLAEGTRPLIPVKPVTNAGVITLTATGAGETTGIDRGSKHGLFTTHLLAGLGGAADRNSDGNVTLDELSSHVRENVERAARLDNRDQKPTISVPKSVDPKATQVVRGL